MSAPSPLCLLWLRKVIPEWVGEVFFRTFGHRWTLTLRHSGGAVEQQCSRCGEWRHDPKPQPHVDVDGAEIREAGPHYSWRSGRSIRHANNPGGRYLIVNTANGLTVESGGTFEIVHWMVGCLNDHEARNGREPVFEIRNLHESPALN